MTFLHDENVYTNVVKKALEESLRKKEAQQQQAAQPGADVMSVARKLVNKLKRELSGEKVVLPNISTEMQGAKGLSPSVVGTLDKLTKYLAENKIKADSYQIAFTGAEYKAMPEETRDQLRLAKLTTKDNRTSNQKFNDSDLWVNVQALVRYVYYLQQKASDMINSQQKEGKLLEVQVGRLIDEIKTRLDENAKLTRKPKSNPDNPNELPDNDPVDYFSPSKNFDSKNPMRDTGNVPLLAKHLRSKGDLNDWLSSGPAHVFMYDKDGKQTTHSYTDENDTALDPCIILRVLYQRASMKASRSGTQGAKAAAFYVKKIKELTPAFIGVDGKQCSLGGTDQPSNTDPATDPNSNLSPQVIRQLMGAMPLSNRDIDFNRIRTFFRIVSPLMTQNSSTMSTINEVQKFMQELGSKYLAHGETPIPLGQDFEDFSKMMKNFETRGASVPNAIQLLSRILSGTRSVIEQFYSAYASIPALAPLKDQILSQIGRNKDDAGSMYAQNQDALTETRGSGTVVQRSGQ